MVVRLSLYGDENRGIRQLPELGDLLGGRGDFPFRDSPETDGNCSWPDCMQAASSLTLCVACCVSCAEHGCPLLCCPDVGSNYEESAGTFGFVVAAVGGGL